jgi:hypothetical protein
MNINDENDVKLKEFMEAAEGQWIDIKAGNPKAGNAKVRAANKIVTNWAKKGLVEKLLSPLLVHESAEIRLAVAAHLINHSCKEEAVAVLRNLTNEPGLVSSMAITVLRVNKAG